jgi:GMP synthase-like glutamine amidotransferase
MVRVGIITMPSNSVPGAASYIPLTIVNWFRSAGVAIVPIPYYLKPRDVPAVFQHINGLYLQGGPNYVDRNIRLSSLFLKEAIKANKAGDYFPVWGTCHGLQIIAKEFYARWPLDEVDSLLWQAHLKVVEPGRMALPTTESLLFNHQYAITRSHFDSTPSLFSAFRILATTIDRQGQEYIAAVEGRELPFYGVQFHPENKPVWDAGFFKAEMEKNRHVGPLPVGAVIKSATRTQCSSEWRVAGLTGTDLPCLRFRRKLKGIRKTKKRSKRESRDSP